MLGLAEAALHRLLCIGDRVLGCLDLVCLACHYTPREIAQTAVWARALARASRRSPAAWSSDLILAFTSDVRSELVRGHTTRGALEDSPDSADAAAGPACDTCYDSNPSVWVRLDDSYSSGWVPLDRSQERAPAGPPQRMIFVAERIRPDPPASPPSSTGGEPKFFYRTEL